jgi:hypothetical protein
MTNRSANIKGKWINISQVRFSNDIEIITFKKGEPEYRTYYFEFGKPSLQPSKVKNYFWKIFDADFEFLNPNRIRFYREGIHDRIVYLETPLIYLKTIKKQDYVKLVPTVLGVSETKVRRLKYIFYWAGENHIIKFNESLDSSELELINKRLGYEGKRMILEKVDRTFLISMYINSERKWIIPVKEIDNTKAILYGLPEKPFEAIAVRLGEEKNVK